MESGDGKGISIEDAAGWGREILSNWDIFPDEAGRMVDNSLIIIIP